MVCTSQMLCKKNEIDRIGDERGRNEKLIENIGEKTEGKRQLARSKVTQENNIKMDYICLANYRESWRFL